MCPFFTYIASTTRGGSKVKRSSSTTLSPKRSYLYRAGRCKLFPKVDALLIAHVCGSAHCLPRSAQTVSSSGDKHGADVTLHSGFIEMECIRRWFAEIRRSKRLEFGKTSIFRVST